MGSRAAKINVCLAFSPKEMIFHLKHDPPVSLYPCCIVDPKYSADDVLLQVGGDELHLDGSVAVDSVFWPVLWAQLNKIGMYTHTYIHTHTRDTQVHQRTHRQNKEKHTRKTQKKKDSLVPESNWLLNEGSDVDFNSLNIFVEQVYVGF